MLQNCNFVTNTTTVTVDIVDTPKSPEINLRIAQSSFSLNTSDQQTKVIYFQGRRQGSWMLWKTKFQINSYHTMSSDKNFIKHLDKIVSYDRREKFHGTISETQYASGNGFLAFFCQCGIPDIFCIIKEIFVRLIVVINLLLRCNVNIILYFSFTTALFQ